MTSYELTMTHENAHKNWIMKYSNKRDAETDYEFFHKLGMSVILREETHSYTNKSEIIESDWNRHLKKEIR